MAAPPQAGPQRAPGGQAAKAGRAERQTSRGSASRIVTLKARPEFLAVRKGARWACPLFVVEALKRESPAVPGAYEGPRFGFTVSKQNGNAVARNRIKRRLRAAVSEVQGRSARPLFDYVLIARIAALDAPFETLLTQLATGLDRVSRDKLPAQRSHAQRIKPPPSAPSS